MPTVKPATAAGIAAILHLPDSKSANFVQYVDEALGRLEKLMGATNYTSLTTGALTASQTKRCTRIGNLLGAAAYLEDHAAVLGKDRGAVANSTVGESLSEAFLSPEDVTRAAVNFRNRAIRTLRSLGLYVRPSTSELTSAPLVSS